PHAVDARSAQAVKPRAGERRGLERVVFLVEVAAVESTDGAIPQLLLVKGVDAYDQQVEPPVRFNIPAGNTECVIAHEVKWRAAQPQLDLIVLQPAQQDLGPEREFQTAFGVEQWQRNVRETIDPDLEAGILEDRLRIHAASDHAAGED